MGRKIIGLVLGMVLLFWWQKPDDKLHAVACDVGQGDAILISYGYAQVLVDGGPSESKVLRCLRDHVPFWDRKLDVVVMTHSDFDHMNGLDEVISRYRVGSFVTGDGLGDDNEFREVLRALEERQVEVQVVGRGDEVVVREREAEMVFRVLWPESTDGEVLGVFDTGKSWEERVRILGRENGDINERSVVMELEYEGKRMLLTGDMGKETEEKLRELGALSDVDVLKVGHHGSKGSSGEEFLRAVKPELAVISLGAGNRYGHPEEEVLSRLEDVGAKVLRTDVEGDVEMLW